MSDNEVVIAAHGLRAGYDDIVAVWDTSIEIRRGEVTGLLGRNGAGKSTIFRALAGVATVHQGSVTWQGRDITGLPPFKRAALGLAVVQEGKRIFRQRSIEENLLLGGFSTGMSRKALAGRVEEMYGRFPVLADRREEKAGGLSGGQQQMLAIGQALMSSPTAILLDEPSAGLAPSIVAEVLDVVTQLGRDEGLAVLLIEQDVELAADVVATATVLELGRVAYQGTADPAAIRAAMEAVHTPGASV